MKLTISGGEVEMGVLTFSEIDFSRKLGAQQGGFTLAVSAHDFRSWLGPIYAECAGNDL